MMKKCNVSFNHQMQLFREKYECKNMKKDMKPYWMSYQKRRFKESYFPAFKKENNKKTFFVICKELIYLTFKWKCVPYHYFRYGLYKKQYDMKTVKKFLPETVFYYSILPKINSEYNLLDNKNVTYDILKANNVPIPKCFFKVLNGNIFDGEGNLIEDDNKLFNTIDVLHKEVVAKYVNCGSGGKQIVVLGNEKGKLNFDNNIVTCKLLKQRFNNWLFQEKLSNIKVLSDVHESSLNTFRIMTYLKDGKAEVLYAMLKFGNNNAKTDNAHTDGVYVRVNINTGITEGLAYNESLEQFINHPYTNHKIDNIEIPKFNQVIETAKKCAMLFPKLTFVGWDIALTTSGAIVLEGNSSPGLTIIQRTHNGMEDFLKLYECKN